MAVTVAIVGRPNVGKSTLFNRLAGRRLALVHDQPGVTRDRRETETVFGNVPIRLIDTAGLEEAAPETLAGRMRRQTETAIGDADVVLFVIDARAGIVPADEHFALALRIAGKPVVLVANKSESRASDAGFLEAYRLGFGDPIATSAEHGIGIPDISEAVVAALPEHLLPPPDDAFPLEDKDGTVGADDPQKPLQIAIIGQPNAGKSTLVNRLIGEERMLTGPEAGITRDSIAIDWEWRGRPIRIADTAGMRRRSKVVETLEQMSVGDAIKVINFAEVVVLLMDATEPFEKQDLQLADLVEREGRALVLGLNKWDLVTDKDMRLRSLRQDLEETLNQVRGVPLVPISALSGAGIEKLMQAVLDVHATWNKRLATAALNRWLFAMVERHPPPAVTGRRIKLKYLTQSKTRPPTFFLSCSRPDALPDAYKRYLVNGLREDFKLAGVPIRLMVRTGENPFEGKRRKT